MEKIFTKPVHLCYNKKVDLKPAVIKKNLSGRRYRMKRVSRTKETKKPGERYAGSSKSKYKLAETLKVQEKLRSISHKRTSLQ
jgi:hypothetical protein